MADASLAKLALAGLKMHKELPGELGFHTLFRQAGCLTVALSEKEVEALKEDHKNHQRIGAQCKLLDPKDIRRKFPYINADKLLLCCYDKREGLVHSFALLWAYFEAFKKVGGEIRKPAKVKKIKVKGGRKGFIIATDIGDLEARKVVVASGIWSSEILKQVGLILPTKLVTREALVTEPIRAFLDPVIEKCLTTFILAQTMRGEIIGTVGMDKSYSLTESSYTFLKEFSRQAVEIVPALKSLKILRQWTWICDITPDGKPIIGETSVDGLYVVCGTHDYGLTITPIVGKLMGELIVEGVPDPLIKPFSPNRFH
jgi:sarcosine oxidase subunit beta